MRISDWGSDVCSSDLRLPCRTHEWLGGLFERAEFLSDRLRMLAWTNVHFDGSQCAFITGPRPGQARGNINAFPQITFIHWRNGPSHLGNRFATLPKRVQSGAAAHSFGDRKSTRLNSSH